MLLTSYFDDDGGGCCDGSCDVEDVVVSGEA